MPVNVVFLKEHASGERRVAMVPLLRSRWEKLGLTMCLASGAGEAAGYPDAAYAPAVVAPTDAELLTNAQVVLTVRSPSAAQVELMQPGAVLIGLLFLEQSPDVLAKLVERKITAFALERVPRISRAQAMDALSSQAALAGYLAVLLGAVELPRILPMMTTAVGSLHPARVLVLGLGVAGLQALATAHRLGAVTEGYDVRPETREEAQSVGARFVETGVDARGEGGYARALTAQEQATARNVLTDHIAQADLVITTANLPGKSAPRLIDRAQIDRMKPRSVIVDLAAESGGNCEGTQPGATVRIGPASLVAPLNVTSHLAQHASELYAKNIMAVLELLISEGQVVLNFDDEIVGAAVVAHDGTRRGALAVPAIANVAEREHP